MDESDLLLFATDIDSEDLLHAFDVDLLSTESTLTVDDDGVTVLGDDEDDMFTLLSGSDPFADDLGIEEDLEDIFDLDFGDSDTDELDIDLDALDADDNSQSDSDSRAKERAEVAEAIENLSLDFLRLLSDAHPAPLEAVADPSRDTKRSSKSSKRPRGAGQIILEVADSRKLGKDGRCGTRKIVFPRNTKHPRSSTKAIAAYMRVAELSHAAIVNNIPMTKRDIYYHDPALFGTQAVVDKLVDDLAATLEVPRAALNIRASPRGLVAGSALSINLNSGESIRGTDTEATLVPVSEDIQSLQVSDDLAWVLIVEKESVFQTLCASRFTKEKSPCGRGLLVTGKGYPDLASRHLVSHLARTLVKSIPILALMDADPYGIDILRQYIRDSDDASTRIEWIGVWGTEWTGLGVDRAQLLPLTDSDRKKALSMLRRDGESMPSRWKIELSHMLFTRHKAEIQILSTLDHSGSPLNADNSLQAPISGDGTALTTYLSRKIRQRIPVQWQAGDDLFGLDIDVEDDNGDDDLRYQSRSEATDNIDLFFEG